MARSVMERIKTEGYRTSGKKTISHNINMPKNSKVVDVRVLEGGTGIREYTFEESSGQLRVFVEDVAYSSSHTEENSYLYRFRTNIREVGNTLFWTCVYEGDKSINKQGTVGGAMPCESLYTERITTYFFSSKIEITYRTPSSANFETIVAGIQVDSEEVMIYKDGIWQTAEQAFAFQNGQWVEGKKS